MPIVGRTELETLLAAWRENGESVALASGAFDVLHVGHVRYLNNARLSADRLIVAVSDDASVEALEGAGRPILSAADRAELVAAFEVVDAAIICSAATAADVREWIQPDTHCEDRDLMAQLTRDLIARIGDQF